MNTINDNLTKFSNFIKAIGSEGNTFNLIKSKEWIDPIEMFKKGHKIHIKKENKGKFTEYCGGKVTSECIRKGKNSPSAVIRKRATFADNVRHFKHRFGGQIVQEFKSRKH